MTHVRSLNASSPSEIEFRSRVVSVTSPTSSTTMDVKHQLVASALKVDEKSPRAKHAVSSLPTSSGEEKELIMALQGTIKQIDDETFKDEREWEKALVVASCEEDAKRNNVLFESAIQAINKYNIEWLQLILGPKIFILIQNYFDKYKKLLWEHVRLSHEKSFYQKAKEILEHQDKSYQRIKSNEALLRKWEEKLEEKIRAIFEPDAKMFEAKKKEIESTLLRKQTIIELLQNDKEKMEFELNRDNGLIAQGANELIKKRDDTINEIKKNEQDLDRFNDSLDDLRKQKQQLEEKIRVRRNLKCLNSMEVHSYFSPKEQEHIGEFLRFSVIEKEHKAAKINEHELDADYCSRMDNMGYDIIMNGTHVPNDAEVKANKIYLYVVNESNHEHKQQEPRWSLRCKAINIHGGIEEIILDTIEQAETIKQLVSKNRELNLSRKSCIFKKLEGYGYLNKAIGAQKYLEKICERHFILSDFPILSAEESRSVVKRIERELLSIIDNLYKNFIKGLSIQVKECQQDNEETIAHELIKVRYLAFMLEPYKFYLKNLLEKFMGTDYLRAEVFVEFLSNHKDLDKLKQKLGLNEKFTVLNDRVSKTEAELDGLKRASSKNKEEEISEFRKRSRKWLEVQYESLDALYKANKPIDDLINEAVMAVDVAMTADLKEIYMPQSKLTRMKHHQDGNTLMHYAMEKYLIALVSASADATTDAQNRLKVAFDVVEQLHIFGCSPYLRNKHGLNAYEYANAQASKIIAGIKANAISEDMIKFALPNWQLIRIGLHHTATYSEAAASFKQELLKYVAKTIDQLEGPFSFIYRLFIDASIKELRCSSLRVLMQNLQVDKYKLNDNNLIINMEKLKGSIKKGILGNSDLLSGMEEVCCKIKKGELGSLSIEDINAHEEIWQTVKTEQQQQLEEAKKRANAAEAETAKAKAEAAEANARAIEADARAARLEKMLAAVQLAHHVTAAGDEKAAGSPADYCGFFSSTRAIDHPAGVATVPSSVAPKGVSIPDVGKTL